jgi:ribonuclease III
MMAGPEARAELENRLGYAFTDPQLLDQALTHSSAVAPSKRNRLSYQRLEFLGDRILGLIVADELFRVHPAANEGELSRALNNVVRKESCAAVARDLKLGAHLFLGDSEARTGGREKTAILGDVSEAIIGAIYIDGGLEAARTYITTHFAQTLGAGVGARADAKTVLQEWAQSRGLPPPDYLELARTGPDHAPEFTIEVRLDGYAPLSAMGASKKVAEHRAAKALLLRENVWHP